MAYFEIKNFNKSFDNTPVLKGINFTLEKGEVLSIIGSSGSGKTTLLRCINFLETPDDGLMFLDGDLLLDAKTVKSESENLLTKKRLNFGLVFQSFNLFPQYTVYKNITLAPTLFQNEKANKYKQHLINEKVPKNQIVNMVADFKKKRQQAIDEDCIALLKKIGLLEKKDFYPHELSGGQQQRVAIARALAMKPKILCFDEPTSALDPELTGEVLKVIRALKNEDRTMIIVTHEMGFAKKVSDKVIFMANGVVEESGTPDEVFNKSQSPLLKSFLQNVDNKDGE